MKSRERQRRNRQLKQVFIGIRNGCGVIDPTPFIAINNLEENRLTFCRTKGSKKDIRQ